MLVSDEDLCFTARDAALRLVASINIIGRVVRVPEDFVHSYIECQFEIVGGCFESKLQHMLASGFSCRP